MIAGKDKGTVPCLRARTDRAIGTHRIAIDIECAIEGEIGLINITRNNIVVDARKRRRIIGL